MLISHSSLVLFVTGAAILLVIPGPAVTYVVSRSIGHGRAAGLVSVMGIVTGTLCHVVAATLGISALLASSAMAFQFVKYLGAAYLIYLGIKTLRRNDEQLAFAAPSATSPEEGSSRWDWRRRSPGRGQSRFEHAPLTAASPRACLLRARIFLDVRRWSNRWVAARIWYWRLRGPFHRNHAGPREHCIVFIFIYRKAGAHFGRSFNEGNRKHHGALQFLLGRWPHRSPATTNDVFDEVTHGRQLRGFPFNWLSLAHHHDGTVVHRMARCRWRTYDAVEQRHAQAKWRAARQRFHQAARRGAV